ncbi:MAG TPA: ubiquitin-conjugating enzyme E2 [Chthonomonadaceae bacterium]|nr:ubiquitin-conjugating enzyme E2 [Chthonomonadaceae bacterium]
MRSARDLRLQSDYVSLRSLARGSGGTLTIEQAKGQPPDYYVLEYRCRTIERLERSKPVYRYQNRVEVRLPARYPAPYDAPRVRMLTPIWHPHVYKNSAVCMGEWKTSEYLDAFALRLGALLQFEREFFDMHDPANEEAIEWARKNLILFPTDTRTFRSDRLATPDDVSAAPAQYTPLMPLPASQSAAPPPPATEDHRTVSSLDLEGILWEDLL